MEKPLSHDVAEGRVAVEAQKKYGVVVQHGTQRRSNAGIAGLPEALKNGTLPKLKIAYGYCCKPRGSIGTKTTSRTAPSAATPMTLHVDIDPDGEAHVEGEHE